MARETISHLPGIFLLIPILITIALATFQKRSEKLRNWILLGGLSSMFIFLAWIGFYVMRGHVLLINYLQGMFPFMITFRIDTLGFLLATVTIAIWFLCSVYSIPYMKKDHAPHRYFPFLIFTMVGALGTFIAGNLYTFFLFFEIMAFSGYVLVIHEETPEAFSAGSKYLMVTIISGILFFSGIIITYQLTGRIDLGSHGIIPEITTAALVAFFAFVTGFGFKAGLFPLHTWLPAAHPVAPAPASALLSGIMIKTGTYGILRVIYNVFGLDMMVETGWTAVLLVFAVITIIYGSLVALLQDDLKTRLAYSSICQIGYILLGGVLLTERGLTGNIFHMVSHATIKSTLFLVAGLIITKTGIRNISKMAGIGYKMPYTMAAFTMGALAMVGIPPLNGFVTKWVLGIAAFDAYQPTFAVVILISSILNALYYFPIVITAFFRQPQAEVARMKMLRFDEGPASMVVPILILAVSLFIFNIIPFNFPLIMAEYSASFFFSP